MLNPPQVGIAIYERRPAGPTATAPTIVASPLAQNIAAGGVATLSVTAAGSPPLAYRWQRNGIDLAGGESAVLVISRAALSNAGTYSVSVANAAGSVTSAGAAVGIVAAEPANTARLSGVGSASGSALVEVYEVP